MIRDTHHENAILLLRAITRADSVWIVADEWQRGITLVDKGGRSLGIMCPSADEAVVRRIVSKVRRRGGFEDAVTYRI